ncbi:MAG: AAA family ATPase, partial [Myxococcota bacterium]|nr:AAA family ATPase [Myxococcota bacterium]
MLLDLRIRDLAIIDDLRLGFGQGFNVISGETGAGKSIILHALGLALGGRASADVVRAGADAAHVEATFEPGAEALSLLDEQGIVSEPGEAMVLRRVVSAAGRSRSFVNGST